MELTHLRSFYAIAQEHSVTRAAARLGLTQPALSLQMKALEVEVGAALFARQRKQMQLTQAGEIFYRHVQTVFATLEEAHAELAALYNLQSGHLAMAASDTNCAYVLPPVLRQFRTQYPQIRVVIRNRMSSQVLHLVLEREVDFGLATLPITHRQVRVDTLFDREDVIICAAGHPLSQETSVSLAQVSPYPLLALASGSTSRQLLDSAFQQAAVPMQVAMQLGSIEVIKRFVESDLGIAVVPRLAVAAEVQQGRLVALPIPDLPRRAIGLVERTDKRRSPAAAAFVSLLQNTLPPAMR
jgi:DNA-binding transcriptional LysR family regulator